MSKQVVLRSIRFEKNVRHIFMCIIELLLFRRLKIKNAIFNTNSEFYFLFDLVKIRYRVFSTENFEEYVTTQQWA